MLKTLIPACVALAALAGCDTAKHRLVTPEAIAPIIEQFKTACVKLDGQLSPASTFQGSSAQCMRGGYSTDLLIHRDFVLLWSDRSANELPGLHRAVSVFCEKDGGEQKLPFHMVGSRLVNHPDSEMACNSSNWKLAIKLGPKSEGSKTRIFGSAPRGRIGAADEGAVKIDSLTRLIRYTTMAPSKDMG